MANILNILTPDHTNTTSCCGMMILRHPFIDAIVRQFLKKKFVHPENMLAYQLFGRRPVIINSVWGFDRSRLLPPNFMVTGPLIDLSIDGEALKKVDPELNDWIEEGELKGQKIVYISLGSVCDWQTWEVDALYNGLKNLPVRVIWSLKQIELFKSYEKDPDFWVRKWIPQPELLMHPSLKAGMTHCGFGGAMEFLGHGIPIACFPHFIDQPPNTMQVERMGCGISLFPIKKLILRSNHTYTEVKFNSIGVTETFKKLLDEEEGYKKNAEFFRLKCIAQGGRKLAGDAVEKVFLVGFEDLINEDTMKTHEKSSYCLSTLFILLLIVIVIGALV
mmetsp:Transcript_4808/g.8245  ORF Transcript_4808/g.8245 Transcript_4808/m.8245 type:complete len:333 (+) Transcript_4808:479-1477(+)